MSHDENSSPTAQNDTARSSRASSPSASSHHSAAATDDSAAGGSPPSAHSRSSASIGASSGSDDRGGRSGGDSHRRSTSRRRSSYETRSPSAGGGSRLPLIAAVKYPKRDESMTVADFLDTSKPLVHSSVPLTRPRGPSFVEERAADTRKLRRTEQRQRAADASHDLSSKLSTQRKYLKARYEFDREKRQAELAIYHKERAAQWAQRLSCSPFTVDLVADNERIEEEAFVRAKLERQRRAVAERKRRRLKNQIIVRALAEVPLLEEARRQKRQMIDEERRDRALRDVQRVEAVQERKVRDHELLTKERQAKNDQRTMLRANSSTPS